MVEVVIVLVIIGILAALVLTSLSGVKAKTRDTARKDEITAIAKQLEDCYNNACSGSYPTLVQLTDTSAGGFAQTNFKNFSNDSLVDSGNSVIQGNEPTASNQYQYKPAPAGCSGISGSSLCTGYTLKAYQETNTAHPYTKESFNK